MCAYHVPTSVTNTTSIVVMGGGGGAILEYAAQEAIDIDLRGLAGTPITQGRESTPISNSKGFFDVVIQGFVTTKAVGAFGNDQVVYVFAWGNTGGTNYPDGVQGVKTVSPAVITLNNPTQLKRLATINITNVAPPVTYRMNAVTLATAFGGVPSKWGIVIVNFCGFSLSDTLADSQFFMQGVSSQGS